MKKLLLATSCLALTSTASLAADLPMSMPAKAPVVAAPIFTWTGCYLGAHAGAGTMNTSNVEGTLNGTGAVAGGQLGCNYQDGNWVIGLEGEGYWSGVRISENGTTFTGNGLINRRFGTTENNDSDYTIAARAGFALYDRTLIYGKAGWAWGSMRSNFFNSCCGVGPTTSTGNFGGTLNGFMVGAGIEHALTRNWTVKFEYDYIGFGAQEVPVINCTSLGVCRNTSTFSYSATKQVFKVGANYLFDFGAAPLVAKY